MSSVTYPDGQILTSSALTQQGVAQIFATLTCGVLGINPPDYSQVRIDWNPQGQPFQNQPQNVPSALTNVTYVAATMWNTGYSQVRDRVYVSNAPQVEEQWTYTKGWRVAWVFYGPGADDKARAVWSATFMEYFSEQVNASNLYVVNDPDAPVYAPEEINGQWFPRADFAVHLYEQVNETTSDGAATSVEVKLYDAQASSTEPVADFTVEG